MLSASLEDYLEEIYRLSILNGTIRTGEIAACLNVTLPSVCKAMQRLAEDGFIYYQPYRDIQLTEKGKVKGEYLVERNSLLQKFLTIIDASCDVAKEAEAMEHYLSEPTILAIRHLVDFLQNGDQHTRWQRFIRAKRMTDSKETL